VITLTLKLVEGTELYDRRNREILMFKNVDWPCVPVPKNSHMRITLGRTDDGEETGWSIVPNAVWFNVDGNITVELQCALNPEIDPFDEFVRYAENDGFVEYSKWKMTEG
jgi:hypothetical protein